MPLQVRPFCLVKNTDLRHLQVTYNINFVHQMHDVIKQFYCTKLLKFTYVFEPGTRVDVMITLVRFSVNQQTYFKATSAK